MVVAPDGGGQGRGSLLSLCICSFIRVLSALFFLSSSSASLHSTSPLRGIHPLDEKYYGAEVIKCKDGSRSFTRDRLNDNFCDCLDGTDEPGTPACPAGKFYSRNLGNTPKFIFSSRVNDNICDCCDGSDEYDGSIGCPNTCIMGGNIVYKPDNYQSRTSNVIKIEESKSGINLEDKIQKLKGLKIVIALQVILIGCLLILYLCRRRVRSKKRRVR